MPRDEDDYDDRPRRKPWEDKGRDDDDRPRRPRSEGDDRPRRPRDEDDEDDDRPRRRRPVDDDDDEYDRPRKKPQGGNGLAVAGLILGILGFCTAGLTAIPGFICSALAMGKPNGRGLAIAGLVLSGLSGVLAIGLLLPAVYKVREAAARMKDSNNQKQIALAFHSHGDAARGVVGPFAMDGAGQINRGLSFRVGLLPHLEQNNLYRQFDLTQAWNSPQNQAAASTVIPTFTTPQTGPPSVNTPYRVFYGGGALFEEDGKPVPLAGITDGTSNTIMLVHAAEQVPWAEPREFRYSDTAPLPKLGPPGGRGANVALADGSVRFIRDTIPESTLRLLITKADGQGLPPGDW